ncbi:FecR family protein [Flavobacterium sp.]|uniref:FecR family protein n=1 Tax=Flavobacterium sp. TaxID=239 RepID=UPI002B4AD29F|nr:FecR family protein [Flavobacterium sp.]HLP64343.1 FecR family protein [Flavobacterium sp.]
MEENYQLAKWLNDEMTEAELKEFQSQPDYHLYEKIKQYSSELQTESFNEEGMLSTILASKKETPKVVPLHRNWMFRIAAILILGFGLFFTYQTITPTTQLAENGKETTFLLPDNSEVVLNSGSEIEYKKWNWDDNRNLELKGEAYFRVAKGKKFQVNTNLGKVSVLGTQFNVKARNNRFDVTCYEGRVKVNYNSEEVILTKGQTVSFESNVKIIHQEVALEKPLWTIDQMDFEKENLTNVVDEIQRQYNVKIEAKDIQSEQLFTGKIPADNIEVALEIIASSYHLKINKINTSSYSMEETK